MSYRKCLLSRLKRILAMFPQKKKKRILAMKV